MRPPLCDRPADLARAAVGTALALALAWFAANTVPLYDVVGRGERSLPAAYVLAWAGILAALAWAAYRVVARVRARRAIGWTPLIAVPLIVEAWIAGLLVAVLFS